MLESSEYTTSNTEKHWIKRLRSWFMVYYLTVSSFVSNILSEKYIEEEENNKKKKKEKKKKKKKQNRSLLAYIYVNVHV